eukprot:m51a1_g9693 putative 3 -cyclic-nucleotide phosphodiesterase (132) ;mRNA; r:1362424-1362819
MARHLEFVSLFSAKAESDFHPEASSADRLLLMQMTMKTADISNITKSTDTYKRWTGMLLEEMWLQGDAEREKGIPVSPFMDRGSCDIQKSQRAFVDFVAVPLFSSYSKLVPAASFLAQRATENKDKWRSDL